jgi:hypothetical protein
MKILLIALTLASVIVPAQAGNRGNPYFQALKLYLTTRMQKGKPVTRALFYLRLTSEALRKVDPSQLINGKTNIEKLDNLNTALHGYPVSWNDARLGLAFEQQKRPLPQLLAIYQEAGKGLWSIEKTESTNRKPKSLSRIKIELTKRGTQTHKEFKRSNAYSPELTGIQHIDTVGERYKATISDSFVNGSGFAVFVISFKSPVPESVIAEYAREFEEPTSAAHSQIRSVERYDDLFQN